jgi:methionine-rich copper-binding protein CopC
LNQETTFTVSVSGATNVAGAQMLPASWSFTTTAPPAVTSKTPAPNATGVALLTTIVAGFDRAVVGGSTSFRLVDSGANVIAGTTNLDGEGAAATFTPSAALVPATTYTVTVSGTASSGGAIMAPVSWSFTTAARPTVTGRTPAAGATAVDVSTPVAATFSQPVTGQTIVVTDPSSAVVPGTSDYDPDTNTATFTPAAPFDAAVTYSVAVSGATNDAGATMLPVSWSFATAIPPSVTTQTPAPGAAGVGLATTVSAGFDRAVTPGSTNFDVVAGGAPVSGSVTLNGAGTVATFTPDAALAPSTTYTVTVSGATSSGGGVMTPVAWNFTTGSAPVVTAQTPAPGATNVAVNTTVAVGFDQAVTGATIVVSDPSAAPVAGSTAYNASTNTATFTPSAPLSSATTYSVVASGATSAAGAAMTPASWSFTTTGTPSVTTQTPAAGATGVALDTTVAAGFDRAVVAGSTTFQVVAGSTPVSGTVALNAAGTLATFTPSAALSPSTTYTVTVSGSASVGSGPMAPVSWTFTTAARPTVTSRTPTPGATNVAVNTTVAVGFDQAVTGATIVVVNPVGTTVAGSTAYDASTNTATFTPSAFLGNGSTYTVTASGATSAAGVLMTPVTWSFTTIAPSPAVTTLTPASGATGVALGTTVSVGFDRAVDSGSTAFQVVAGSTPVAGSLALNAAGTVATFTPTSPLTPSTTYTATVSGSTSAGSGPMAPVSWTFATAAAPTVTSQSPAPGATSIALNTTVAVGFNQAVTGATIVVTGPGGAVVGSTAYNASTNTATFTPSAALSATASYSVIASGATNAAGATMTPVTWSFSTVVAPSITARTPAASATGVALGATVSVTFDRPVVSGTTAIQLTGAGAISGSLILSGGGTIATFTPSATLTPATTYSVTVSGATATSGGAVMSPATWSFTTAARPTVTSVTPASGATGAAVNSAVSIVYSEAVTGQTVVVTDPAGNAVAGTNAFNAATKTATFTPSAPLNSNMTYNITVSGATNAAGATMLPITSSFTTFNYGCPCRLFATSATPSTSTVFDFSSTELGLRFKADVNGVITGVRFYKGSFNGGTHVGSLWTNTGTLLGRVTFSGESSSGWQQANFATPVPVTAGTLYVVSYHANSGRYSQTANYFSSGGAMDVGPLHAPTGSNGLLVHSSSPSFPSTTSSSAANYFVDAVFMSASAPTVTSTTPTNGATGASRTANLTAQFNVPVQSSSLSFTLTSGGSTVSGALSLDSTGTIATFNPTSTLNSSTTYTASVRAKDSFGNQMVTPFTWTFRT